MKNEKTFNIARQKAFDSLCITLDTLYGKCNISEIDFKNEWYNNLKKQNNIIADGWYTPPPKGMAVLFGNRVSFDSLRNKKRIGQIIQLLIRIKIYYTPIVLLSIKYQE